MKGLAILFLVLAILITGSISVAQETEPSGKDAKKIDINSATLEELDTLPGIGPKLGQAIIDGRPYKKVEDLLQVKGIGQKRFAKIKDLVIVKELKKTEEKDKAEEKPAEKPKG